MLRSGKRDRHAEDEEWRRWFRHIGETVSKTPGVTYQIIEATDKAYYPTMMIRWDPKRIGLTAGEIGKALLDGEPRIMTHAARAETDSASQMLLRPAAMWPEEYRIVASRLHEVLSHAPGPREVKKHAAPTGDVSGPWVAKLDFSSGSAKHSFYLDANGNKVTGNYTGRVINGPIEGHVDGSGIEFTASGRIEGAMLGYTYKGSFDGDKMTGTVSLGEYGTARFTATRKA